jgi:hypothetical protein
MLSYGPFGHRLWYVEHEQYKIVIKRSYILEIISDGLLRAWFQVP